jgi:hypothetical protein
MVVVGDKVGRLVGGHIERVSEKGAKAGGVPKTVAFSLRLGRREHARLIWLAERLEMPKTPLAEGLLNAAVEEAIEQYAAWAAPEDPEGYLREVLADDAEGPDRPRGGPHGRSPGGPHGGPSGRREPNRRD